MTSWKEVQMSERKSFRTCWIAILVAFSLICGVTEASAWSRTRANTPLTKLMDNGFSSRQVLSLLEEAGISGLRRWDLYKDPMDGLSGSETFTDKQVTLLQAATAVNLFFLRLDNYEWGPGDEGDTAHLTEAVRMVQKCLSEAGYQKVHNQLDPTLADFDPPLTIDHLISATNNLLESLTIWARNGDISDPVVECELLFDSLFELTLHYYVLDNRGNAAIEEAIRYEILPDISGAQYPQVDLGGTVTIYNEDGSVADSDVSSLPVDSSDPGTFVLSSASYSAGEGSGAVDVTINRIGGSNGAASVQVRTLGVTADYATDYDSFSWTTFDFSDGEDSKTISISIVDDSAVEEDETFRVLLGNPTGGTTLGTVNESTVTIVDNDADTVANSQPGSFELSAVSYSVNEGDGKVNVLIKRVDGTKGAATIEARTLGATASYATDYDSFSWTTLNFADGQAEKTISIGITDDAVAEDNETFTVLLRNPTGGTSLGSIVESTVTIVDNDSGSTTYSGSGSDSVNTTGSTPNPDLSYIPVFPGAMGHGTETKAGRGGQIIRVTNLNDSGAGSLRAAIDASGPRIIVFEVSGTIHLKSDLKISTPYITLAGQTAPSPGINLRGAGVRISTHDVLVQHIRIRTGDDPSGPTPSNRDTLQVLGPNAYNVVVDHVSGCWSVDETMSTWYAVNNITFSNNLLSEALSNSLHSKGSHSMGVLIGNHAKVTFIRNLVAHCAGRNPRILGDTEAAVINNVYYNARTTSNFGSIGSDVGPTWLTAVGNRFIAGPNTGDSAVGWKVESSAPGGTQLYFEDNQAPGGSHKSTSKAVSTPPVWHESLSAYPASQVEDMVLGNAGARPADRDAVDARVISEVRNRTGTIKDSTSEVGGWPTLANNHRAFNAPSNPNGDDDGDGYTNIEEVLHYMAAQVE